MQTYLIRSLVNPLLEYTILSDSKGVLGNKVKAEAIFSKNVTILMLMGIHSQNTF